jgi:hypothetical protein
MEVGSLSVIHDLDLPQLVLGVTPPLEDDCSVKRNFAAGAMEKHFTPGINQGSDGEEIAHKAWWAISKSCLQR